MRELRVTSNGARALGFVIPRDLCDRHGLRSQDEVYFSPGIESQVHMHFYNPSLGAAKAPELSRCLRQVGSSGSLSATLPWEFVDRLEVIGGGTILAVPVRDGLYLYPATADRARTLMTLGELVRQQRRVLHAMGAPC